MTRKQLPNGSHFLLASNEAGELDGKVVAECGKRPKRGKIRAKIRVVELVDLLGPLQVLEVMQAEVDKGGARGHTVKKKVARRLRNQDLPAMSDGQHPRRAVQGRSDVVSV